MWTMSNMRRDAPGHLRQAERPRVHGSCLSDEGAGRGHRAVHRGVHEARRHRRRSLRRIGNDGCRRRGHRPRRPALRHQRPRPSHRQQLREPRRSRHGFGKRAGGSPHEALRAASATSTPSTCAHAAASASWPRPSGASSSSALSATSHVSFYDALRDRQLEQARDDVPLAASAAIAKARRVGEARVLDSIDCACSRTQHEQPPSEPLNAPDTDGPRMAGRRDHRRPPDVPGVSAREARPHHGRLLLQPAQPREPRGATRSDPRRRGRRASGASCSSPLRRS